MVNNPSIRPYWFPQDGKGKLWGGAILDLQPSLYDLFWNFSKEVCLPELLVGCNISCAHLKCLCLTWAVLVSQITFFSYISCGEVQSPIKTWKKQMLKESFLAILLQNPYQTFTSSCPTETGWSNQRSWLTSWQQIPVKLLTCVMCSTLQFYERKFLWESGKPMSSKGWV